MTSISKSKNYSGLFLSLLAYIALHTLISTLLAPYFNDMGLPLIIASVVSLAPPLLWMGKDRIVAEFRDPREKITVPFFIAACASVFVLNIAGGMITKYFLDALRAIGLNLSTYTADVGKDTPAGISYMLVFYSVLIAPIAEELIFRVVLFRSTEKINVGAAIVISSILFAIMHGNLDQALSVIPVALLYGYLAHRYAIWVPIAAHITNNVLTNILMIFKDQDAILLTIVGISAVAFVVVLVSLIKYIKKHHKALPNDFPVYVKTLPFWAFVLFNIVIIVISEM